MVDKIFERSKAGSCWLIGDSLIHSTAACPSASNGHAVRLCSTDDQILKPIWDYFVRVGVENLVLILFQERRLPTRHSGRCIALT